MTETKSLLACCACGWEQAELAQWEQVEQLQNCAGAQDTLGSAFAQQMHLPVQLSQLDPMFIQHR